MWEILFFAYFRSSTSKERRVHEGKESSESLNSAASGSDPSSSPLDRLWHHTNITQEEQSTPRGLTFLRGRSVFMMPRCLKTKLSYFLIICPETFLWLR